MSGYYDNIFYDSSNELYRDNLQAQTTNYVMNKSYWMRDTKQVPLLGPVQNVDFYGPLVGRRVTQESFLQGRGGTLSKNPACEIVMLPEKLFPNTPYRPPSCERVDLQPLMPRVKPTCNGLRETDMFPFYQMPENFKPGYLGMKTVVDTNLPTRMPPLTNPNSIPACAESYASYAPSYDMRPYA